MSDECMEIEKEPTWLDKYREEKGMRVGPDLSRELEDVGVSPLTKDVAFNRHSMNDGDHVSPTDNATIQVGTDGIRVSLAQGINEDAFRKTCTAALRATVGLDMGQTLPGDWEHCDVDTLHSSWEDDDWELEDDDRAPEPARCIGHDKHRLRSVGRRDIQEGQKPMQDWEEMLKGGLQTALETQTIVFAVGGVSRTGTHQLVRSRRAAFHQQSQRAGYMGDAPEFRMPESVWVDIPARQAMIKLAMDSWNTYKYLCDRDIAYQDARFALLEGTTNFILLEYPLREFLNVYAYRACSMFQWEIVHVMREAKRVLLEEHPWLEPYVKISCEKTGPAVIPLKLGDGTIAFQHNGIDPKVETVAHHCTFQGWEDVEGQCDFSWAKHEARTFKPEFHRITREPKS